LSAVKAKAANGFKIISDNRSAGHDYELMERFEAGLVLTGTEVKACRAGKVQLKDGFANVEGGEAWLINAHISEYSHGNIANHLPGRKRKLLLHRPEIDKLHTKTREKGLAIIPTKMYFKDGKIKVEIAVARGKKLHDKRAAEKTKEQNAEARAALIRSKSH
jgi:SsrA-binding protein